MIQRSALVPGKPRNCIFASALSHHEPHKKENLPGKATDHLHILHVRACFAQNEILLAWALCAILIAEVWNSAETLSCGMASRIVPVT